MATEHNSITADADKHEPKGAATATLGQVYVFDGAASGAAKLIAPTLTYTFTDISTASSQWVVCPVAAKINKIYSVLHDAISGANCGFTFEIGGTAVTNGAITITQSGSAAGDVDSSTPTANNTLTAGQAIELISDGASTGTVNATFTFLLQAT